ncbi:uncharacterized protein LOC127387934 [Apus apus]|uniref:uncharacterized protein LOC127387934 n=1 Tax=Apus apus TaxID=8895 RepID=UPI0021F86FB0|nr:uncharacterized protein LOC127387934 [Apus apus]
MAWWRAGLPLRLLLLLSLAGLTMPDLMTETTVTDVTMAMSPTLPTSVTPLETSELLPTTAATISASEPGTGASTLENSSMSPVTGSASSPSAPAPTAPSAEPSITPYNTTADPDTSTEVPGSTPDISTVDPTLDTSTAPESPSTTTGMEPSSLTTDSSQTSETTTCVCTTPAPNTSASHLFLSLRLTVPLDLGNATVQELVLSKLREDLQTAFPCAGLVLKWREKRRI